MNRIVFAAAVAALLASATCIQANALVQAAPAATSPAEHTRDGVKFSTGPDPAFVVRRDLPAQWDPAAPGADDRRWRVWRFETQADRRGGRDVVFYDYAFQARTASLLGEAGKFQIDFNPEYQRMTLHRVELLRDGRWENRLVPDKISLARREEDFEQDMTNGSVTALIVLEDVRVDDVVRLSYSIAGSNPILAGQTTDWTTLAWRNPMLQSRLRVLYDPGTEIAVHRENTTVQPQQRRRADALEVVVEANATTPVVEEGSYPVWYQPYPRISIAPKRRWDEVVAWALPLYPKVSEPFDAELEARIVRWRALPDAAARLTAALRTVQNDVRYFGVEIGDNTHKPNPPQQVWRNRYGDCKDKVYLLMTILERLGIEAVPALVSIDRGRAIGDFVPSASAFDHVIVRARIDGRDVWVDPTLTQQGGDPRRADLSDYGMALPVVAGQTALQPIPAPAEANAGVEVIERFEPAVDGGEVIFSVETVYTGSSADYQRRSTLSANEDDLARRYAEYYRKRFGELDVISRPKVEDDMERNVLRVREKYALKSPLQTQSGGVRVLETYAETLQGASTLPNAVQRTGPLDFVPRGRYRHELTVALPERWKPAFTGDKTEIGADAFRYARRVDIQERQVQVVYDLQVQRSEVPADAVAAHLREVRKLRGDLSANLRFTIPAAQDDAQRQERLRDLLNDVLNGEDGK